ncbi:MAG: hypothetical protein HYU53_08330 [Acidobacteria bacterium]|nr:hypothetical protein [Acidobacteriota bacterium]
MSGAMYVVLVLVGVAAFFVVMALRAYVTYRGVRVVTCPETKRPAAVRVDAAHAAVSAAWDHTELRLDQCSRWPERGDCAQPCLHEIAAAPQDCLVRSILGRWFAGKTCVFCHKPIALFTHAQQPALRDPDGHTFDFAALPAEDLIARLPEFDPVCFDCHIAEQFRADYPERVLDRRF